MSGARILAIGGTIASVLSMLGGWSAMQFPRAGTFMLGTAGAVMLGANLVVAMKREGKNQ